MHKALKSKNGIYYHKNVVFLKVQFFIFYHYWKKTKLLYRATDGQHARSSWQHICHFGGTLIQQVIGLPKDANRALLLVDPFLYSYESELLQNIVKDKILKEARYIDILTILTL